MINQLNEMKKNAEEMLQKVQNLDNINDLKVQLLGRKGTLTNILRGIKDLQGEEKVIVGRVSNEIKSSLEQMFEQKISEFKAAELTARLRLEKIDITAPGIPFSSGTKHPINLVINEIQSIFISFGFTVEAGPEIETDYYNFEALNLPQDHPARDMQDSFYIDSTYLLRTHTSPVQVRTMEKLSPSLPVKIIVPGKVYRKDDDATHSPMFHQIEGLWIGENINFSDLKGMLMLVAQRVFGAEVKVRFRPSYFPFTEPSAEMDISCMRCAGKGCRVCKQTGWLEILGSGMVHPRVLTYGGYDPEKVTGFAFGLGIERVAMLKYDINDLRLFYDNDQRFLQQF